MNGLVQSNCSTVESGDPVEPEVKLSVGDEFILWAEKYWELRELYEHPHKENEEACAYNYVRSVFATKIDELIKDKLNLS